MNVTAQTTAISNVYRLLSQLWIKEVDENMLAQLQQPDLRHAYESVGGTVPLATEIDALAVEYCRLFIGPQGHLSLLQSVWDRGQLESDITDSMRQFVDLFGFQPEPELPDHFGLQLAVMGQAIQLAPTQATREAIASYFDRHLLWSQRLLPSVVDRDDSTFYGSLAKVTDSFLLTERAVLSELSRRPLRRS